MPTSHRIMKHGAIVGVEDIQRVLDAVLEARVSESKPDPMFIKDLKRILIPISEKYARYAERGEKVSKIVLAAAITYLASVGWKQHKTGNLGPGEYYPPGYVPTSSTNGPSTQMSLFGCGYQHREI